MDEAVYVQNDSWSDGPDLKSQLLVLPPNFALNCSASPVDGSYTFVLPESDQTSLIANGVKNGIYLLIDGNGVVSDVAEDPAVGKTRIGDLGKVRSTDRREMIVVKDPRHPKVVQDNSSLSAPPVIVEKPQSFVDDSSVAAPPTVSKERVPFVAKSNIVSSGHLFYFFFVSARLLSRSRRFTQLVRGVCASRQRRPSRT
jgi:hypothetical protein